MHKRSSGTTGENSNSSCETRLSSEIHLSLYGLVVASGLTVKNILTSSPAFAFVCLMV